MKPITSSALAALLLVLGSAQAQQMPTMTWSGAYAELGYTFMKIDAFGTSFRPGVIRGILGYDANPYFAIEGMAAGGVTDDEKNLTVSGIPVKVESKMDYMYGIWVKPKYQYQQSELFARIGWAHTKAKFEAPGFASRSESQDDLAWGLGVNFRPRPNVLLGIDWMRYSNQSNSHVDGLTLSAGWHW
jgi:opacity protein-like surface antigen